MAETSKPQNETHVVTTTAGNVRITQPKGTTRRRKPKVTVLVSPDELVRRPLGGFVGFLREHAIVGLAVGFVIGTQVQALVKQLIASFIDPLSGLLFNGTNLSNATLTLHWHGRHGSLGWGAFAYAFIDFLFVLAAVYAVIKIFKLDKLDKPKQ